MRYQEAVQQIKKGQMRNTYFIYGTEDYLIHLFQEALSNQCFGSEAEKDLTRLNYQETSLAAVLDEAESFAFFSAYRLIIVEDFMAPTSSGEKLDKKEVKRLEAYLKNPNPSSILIFYTPLNNLDKRKKITKILLKYCPFVDLTPLTEQEVFRYINTYLQQAKLQLTKEALNELLNRTNYQLSAAMNELNKLETYAQGGLTVGIEVVRALVPKTLESDVFRLTDAMLKGQVEEAVSIYQDLILLKNEPIALHALIVSQIRIIIQVSILSRRTPNEKEMAGLLGVHPYRVKLALQQSYYLPLNQLVTFYEKLIDYDFKLKTSSLDPELPFYLLLFEFNQIKNTGRR